MDNVGLDLRSLAEDPRRYPNLYAESGVRHKHLARLSRAGRPWS